MFRLTARASGSVHEGLTLPAAKKDVHMDRSPPRPSVNVLGTNPGDVRGNAISRLHRSIRNLPALPAEEWGSFGAYQQLYNLSDDALDCQLLDRVSFQRCAGLESSVRVPMPRRSGLSVSARRCWTWSVTSAKWEGASSWRKPYSAAIRGEGRHIEAQDSFAEAARAGAMSQLSGGVAFVPRECMRRAVW